MYISYNIFVEALADYSIEENAAVKDKHFSQVDIVTADGARLAANHLYVCPLSLALRLSAAYPFCTFIALRDRFKRDNETPELLANIVVVNEDISLAELFSTLNNVHAAISSWRVKMADAIIQDRSLEELLSFSQDILGNFISISDSTLSLVAYTHDIAPSDSLSINLIKNGFHDEQAVSLFKKHNRFELWQTSDGLLYDTTHATSSHPVISKVFKYGGTYFTHVVMVCNNHPSTPGLIDKYVIFLEYLSVYFDKHLKNQQESGKMYFSVIRTLLDSTNVRSDILAESAEQLGLPLEGSFWLMIFTPIKSGSEPAGIIMHEIQELLPRAKIAVYRQSLLAIISSGATGEMAAHVPDEVFGKISAVIELRNFCCGISATFHNLADIKGAYSQASVAISYGKRLMGVQSRSECAGPFFKYESFYMYLLLGEPNNTEFLTSGNIYEKLQTLRKYDKRHNSDNFGLLYLYLTLERHAGNTAAKLFMSRNNVAYRIARIVELLDLDLSDYLTRMGLLISYEMLNLDSSL